MTELLNPGFGFAAMLVALATAFVASRWLSVETGGRNVPLDGLRGYMAFGVFLVLLTCVTFRLIERPAMQSARRVTSWLSSVGSTLARRQKA